MPTKITYTPEFIRQTKKLEEKYRGSSGQIKLLVEQLLSDQRPGEKIPESVPMSTRCVCVTLLHAKASVVAFV
ncbi:MAG: hypothetical protein SGJ24_02900 [Chloroflexota bacterium]|nr:hypothetical protein [Chloroflexota bacterium]